MNHCEKYQDLCSAALDDVLTESEKQELEQHLAMCPSCRAYMEEMRAMHQLWKETEVSMPSSLHEKIMQQIQTEVEGTVVQIPQKQRRRPPVFTMLAAAAACVMLAVSGNLTGLFGQLNAVPITPSTKQQKDAPSVMENTLPEQEITPPKVQQEEPMASREEKPPVEPKAPPKEEQPRVAQEEPDVQQDEQPEQEVPQVPIEQPANQQVMVASEPPPEQEPNSIMPRTTLSVMPPALPEALQTMVFARCFTLSGSGELPVVEDMTLLVSEENTSYYSIENNESKLEKVRQELKKAGYELTLDESSGVTLQRDAQQVLVIYKK